MASTLSTYFQSARPTEATRPQRWSDGTTSAAVISLPLWNLTDFRRLIVYLRPLSVSVHESASSGTGLKLLS